MNRPKFISHMFFIALTIVSYVAEARPVSEAEASRETEIPSLHILESAEDVAFGYVERDTVPGGGKYLCGGMSVGAARSSAKVVDSALAYVPGAALARMKPKYIILCSRTMAAGQEIGGIPVPPLNLLMLNVGGGLSNTAYGRHIVLHELYHLVEYRVGAFNDAEWNKRFGGGYANSYSGRLKQSYLGDGKPGFLNSYAETFPHEERAELFAFLLLDPDAVAKHLKRTGDRTLKSKVSYFIDRCNGLLGTHLSLPNT